MQYKKAFSLVEMSLVLILIGILVVTILVAKEMRAGATNRMVIKDIDRIQVALNQFYDTFGDAAGDSNKIYKFWANECASEAVCNGNGNRIIEAYKESHLVWLHLSLAEIFAGNFTGAGDGDTQTQTRDVNVPRSVIENGQYSILYYDWGQFPDHHLILLGTQVAGDIGYGAVLDANAAYEIDNKIDDGLPSTGNIYGRNGYKNGSWLNTNCLIDVNNNNVINSESEDKNIEYNMNLETKECIMGFRFNMDIN